MMVMEVTERRKKRFTRNELKTCEWRRMYERLVFFSILIEECILEVKLL